MIHSHWLSLLLFSILQAAACMDVSIVGGKEASKPTPWLVSIQVNQHHICGGTLINEQWVLTAAHCKEALFRDLESVTVLLGALSLKKSKDTQRIRVLSYKISPEFSTKTKVHDLMLVKLEEKVQQKGTTVKVKAIPKSVKDILTGTKCKVSGWGTTVWNQNVEAAKASDLLHEAEVTVIERELCQCYYNNNPKITEDMLCAGNKLKRSDACLGDSGGPLECKKSIVAVVSGGHGCGDPKKPGIYTLLSNNHISWINSIMKKHSNSTVL